MSPRRISTLDCSRLTYRSTTSVIIAHQRATAELIPATCSWDLWIYANFPSYLASHLIEDDRFANFEAQNVLSFAAPIKSLHAFDYLLRTESKRPAYRQVRVRASDSSALSQCSGLGLSLFSRRSEDASGTAGGMCKQADGRVGNDPRTARAVA